MHNPDDPNRHQEVLVSPMYLAGSGGSGAAGFAPIAHWPHHYLDDGPCQVLVTSPDGRIRVGWFGDDFELWKISAAVDAVSAPRWTATFNHVTPPELVAGLTTALAQDYADACEDDARFLASPSWYWRDTVRPLTEAGWTHDGGAELGTVEITAPGVEPAGMLIDNRLHGASAETVELWAGPPGWGTRAEAIFTRRTPTHLIAATAAVMANGGPVIRERHQIDRQMERLVTLTPLVPAAPAADPQAPRTPTPLDVRRTAVTQAVHRAARAPRTAADLRVMAAQSRSAGMAHHRPGSLAPAAARLAATSPAPRHAR
ncbi:DUF317 domain-containing protein [Streptomyces sp. NPDC090023]|uniref:DUF317 domain-containing protein n=1 Tax=unclassified Streptomyces TaxID=2593676 RepID=UPI0037F60A09